ncbi:MAG: hypothetical protein ACTSVM_05095 [Candidatus Ranarchaeia archaeon]
MSINPRSKENADLIFQEDRIIKKLLRHSNLTRIQFETLLINFHLDERFGKRVKYDRKSKLRKTRITRGPKKPSRRTGVTRGAFRRVLGQAGNNVIKSIYTIMLLAYVGLIDSPSLQPYVQLSDMLQSYLEDVKSKDATASDEHTRHLKLLEKRLLSIIEEYSDPFKISR